MKIISAREMLNIINKPWAGTNEIMQIGCIGKNKALEIKKEIKQNLEQEGYYLPKNLVPMESVTKYFKIDINYLNRITKLGIGG